MQSNLLGIVVVIALVLQVSILAALFFTTRRAMQKMEKTVTDLNARAGPILTRVQILLDDTQPKISTMVSDAAHIVYLARGQAQKMDRVVTDVADRFCRRRRHWCKGLKLDWIYCGRAGEQPHRLLVRSVHRSRKKSCLFRGSGSDTEAN